MSRLGFWVIAGMLVVPAIAAAQSLSSTSSSQLRLDCSEVKLQAVVGFPGTGNHQYELAGTCRQIMDRFVDGEHRESREMGRAFLRIIGDWDAGTNLFRENATLEGDEGGKIQSIFKCSADPYVAATLCSVSAHGNDTQWGELTDAIVRDKLPLGAGKTTFAEAVEKASTVSASLPSPPPPAPPASRVTPTMTAQAKSFTQQKPQTVDQGTGPIGLLPVATEPARRVTPGMASLLAGAKSNGLPPMRQPMSSYGPSWKDGDQIFWRADKIGQQLVLPINLPASGRYQLVGSFTKAGDYGIIQIVFNGRAVGDVINLYSRGIVPAGPMVLGTVSGKAGANKLIIWTVGKDRRSTGHFVGLDELELIPLP